MVPIVDSPRGVRMWVRGLLALLCAVWVWVFLPVLVELKLLVNAASFIPVLAALALIQLLPSRVFRAVLALAAIVVYMLHYFTPPDLTWIAAVKYMAVQWAIDAQSVLVNHVLVDPLQTTLFLFLLAAMYWLVSYTMLRRRLFVFYTVLAVLVLAVLDSNTNVHPNQAIVELLLASVCILGLARFAEIDSLESRLGVRSKRRSSVIRFFIPMAVLVAGVTVLSVVLPKQPAVWANPLQRWQGSGTGASGTGNGQVQQVIGYESNNSHLGGSLLMNYDPVFSVVTNDAAYLRGQSYSTYTGKGWVQSNMVRIPVGSGSNLPQGTNTDFSNLPFDVVKQRIAVLAKNFSANVIFGGYSIQQVTGSGVGNGLYYLNQASDSLFATDFLKSGQVYSVDSRELQDPTQVLTQLESHPNAAAQQGIPPQVAQVYLQLPASLPKQVGALAQKLTRNDSTELKKVESIEGYLKNNFQYTTTDVPVPGRNQDYVAQFLFETQRGYCNNFSSAMAVMLRTVGVPTRWVTGFTQGSQDFNYTGPGQRYIVTNADAHSWVEVYFPGVGWVPFDPTPGFSMTFAQGQASQSGTVPPVTPKNTPQPKPTKTPQLSGSAFSVFSVWPAIKWLGLALLAAFIVLAAVFRRNLNAVRIWRGNQAQALARALRFVIKRLHKQGRLEGRTATLREVAGILAVNDGTAKPGSHAARDSELNVRFVHTAEAAWYRKRPLTEDEVKAAKDSWKKWLKKL
ncbi:transglutaminase-like domain-containing protein [Alicyclobacillus tolerans]|uniref:transglutaminase-like domain-containing protein n=1 Tax=Alicyclobacillus tolerans TaxID=90970 RepID=UPI001F27E4BB|nr:transglutaminase-like domain-containing protein [Alicyclobacillus tolerans]MCF8566332.1 transglutaminase-like domain-containing protein [Alicyclobacillus tolerans]